MVEQKIIRMKDHYKEIDRWIGENGIRKVFLVCGRSLQKFSINEYFKELPARTELVSFSHYQPNPLYESVVEGVELFRENACDGIIAVGGGSAMDVAKCIKLYSNMDPSVNYLKQPIVPNDIPFLAVPTTAGTGSEATRYAVIYYQGVKQSVTHESCIPGTVLMDASVLRTLPLYQKKSTMLDALCHGIESYWSVNSTEESREYSRQAIRMIFADKDGYLANDEQANENMLMAAHMAGRAINVTQTTAGHAMCYKITSLFHVTHGHAAALCDRVLYPWMIENLDKTIDPRGEDFVRSVLEDIAHAMGEETAGKGAARLSAIFDEMELEVPAATPQQYAELKVSVNPTRLKNHPVQLTEDVIDMLYHRILKDAVQLP